MEEQLKSAQAYLQQRAMSTGEVKNDELIRLSTSVVSASEVEAVLDMVMKGTFLDFYKKYKKMLAPIYNKETEKECCSETVQDLKVDSSSSIYLKIVSHNEHSYKAHLNAFKEMHDTKFEVDIHKVERTNGVYTLVLKFFGEEYIKDVYFFGYLVRQKQMDAISN